jgi:hypothetical protein
MLTSGGKGADLVQLVFSRHSIMVNDRPPEAASAFRSYIGGGVRPTGA